MLVGVAQDVAAQIEAGSRQKRAIAQPIDQSRLSLLEPQGNAAMILLQRMEHLESQAHRIILGNDLTSTTKQAGPTGSSQVQESQQKNYIMRYGRGFCDDFGPKYSAWADANNPDFPKLGDDEAECYLQFQPLGKRTKIGLPEKSGVEELDAQEQQPVGGDQQKPQPLTLNQVLEMQEKSYRARLLLVAS
jgi:hypothetical protein